jgi:rfaE bifunctional protein kinase chain/domain
MQRNTFHSLAARYAQLRIAILGDFCLDRYLEIDPQRSEQSIETGREVYNVMHVRAQPGGAGTILNNLIALGIGQIDVLSFCGDDGEGYELRRALAAHSSVNMRYFLTSSERRTFTYCKPLLLQGNQPPLELNRLDSKNWSPTPPLLEEQLQAGLLNIIAQIDALIVLDQVDVPETGVVTTSMREALRTIAKQRPTLRMVADSRRGLHAWPPVTMKMNAAELSRLTGVKLATHFSNVPVLAAHLARERQRDVIVTLAERGLLGATPEGRVEHVPALPLRGEIDIVGAGDSVTANLTAAMAAGADLREALEIAAIASSIVIHQLGTTGTATVLEIEPFCES